MKVLQINTTVNTGSTGRIAEDIGKLIISKGHESFIAFGSKENSSQSNKIVVGTKLDFYAHTLKTRLFDRHGFGSFSATEKLIKTISEIQPDIIHLHNIHGYYLHIESLFNFLRKYDKPVVWTLHDCWAFTGHCAFFDDIGCTKWKTHCNECPKTNKYPHSWLIDNSYKNFADKKRLFTSGKIHIVVPSNWLGNLISESFLGIFPTSVIYNGVDTNMFKPYEKVPNEMLEQIKSKKVILGVANVWQSRKGLAEFINLSKVVTKEYLIVLVGLTHEQIKDLPDNILGITRTESISQLADWYAFATAFVNPTWLDNFPTTNIEALACGTPVITYPTGGSPEAVNDETGFVVEKGNVNAIWEAIQKIDRKGKGLYKETCRKRALQHFNKEDRYEQYVNLYQSLLKEYRGE